MSLVLEALKKADAERERERAAVPGLHASPATLAPPPHHHRPAVLAWGVAGVAVVCAAVFGWQALRRDAAPPASTAAAPPAPAALPAPPVPRAQAPAVPPAAAPETATAPPAPRRAPPSRMEPAPAPQPAPLARQAAPAPPTTTTAAASPARGPAAAAQPSPATPPIPPRNGDNISTNNTENRIYDNAQALPDDARRGLPALSIGGAMYSETAANRMLIVNGQLFREKDVLAPDLVLEQIALKSAVMRWRNYRFRVSY